jgi:uncharacterized protein (DUF697 family)
MGTREFGGSPWGMFQTLRSALDGKFDGASEEAKDRAVHDVVQMSSIAASAVALEPVPFVDNAAIFEIHHWMSKGVARIREQHAVKDPDAVLKALRLRLLAPHLTLAATKLVPFAGEVVAFSVAYSVTSALGSLTDRDYRSGCRMSQGEIVRAFDGLYREWFAVVYKLKRDELRARFLRPPVKHQIDNIHRAAREGRIEPEEAERQMEEVLRRATPPKADARRR